LFSVVTHGSSIQVPEWVHFDGVVIMDGVRGGSDGAIYRRFLLDCVDFCPIISKSMTYTRWLQGKRVKKLCDNSKAPKKGHPDYNPAYKYCMLPETLVRIQDRTVAKGDVLTVADVAAVMAAKRTADLIPMCHSLPLTGVDIAFDVISDLDSTGCVGLSVVATVKCVGQTGVEMEALCAASTALLTVYDMCKAMDRGMHVEHLRLEEKSGGKSGVWRRSASVAA